MIIDTFTITGIVTSVVILAVVFSLPVWRSKGDHHHADSDPVA